MWTRDSVRRWIKTGIGEPPPVSGAKGGASKAEQQAADQQRAMQNQIAQQQLQMQQNQINSVNRTIDPMIAQGGMSPQQEAAMTSLLLNNLPQQVKGVAANINQQLAARGISGGQFGAGSGDIARDFAQLGVGEAGLQQEGLSNIQLAKAQQLQQLLGLKLGIGGMYGQNVGISTNAAGQALNAGVTAANNYDQAQTSWLGPVFGALGSIGRGTIGGISNLDNQGTSTFGEQIGNFFSGFGRG